LDTTRSSPPPTASANPEHRRAALVRRSESAHEVSDRRIDRDHEIELGDGERRVAEVVQRGLRSRACRFPGNALNCSCVAPAPWFQSATGTRGVIPFRSRRRIVDTSRYRTSVGTLSSVVPNTCASLSSGQVRVELRDALQPRESAPGLTAFPGVPARARPSRACGPDAVRGCARCRSEEVTIGRETSCRCRRRRVVLRGTRVRRT